MILRRVLLPGQQVRQAELAAMLEVSRSPIREALQGLAVEGLVSYERNRGYFVAKLRVSLLKQAYRMRELLETELLHQVRWPDPSEIQEIRRIQGQLVESKSNINMLVQRNREFHFAIYALAELSLITDEVSRLWRMTEAYRALYLVSESARDAIIREHDAIIDCLVVQDRERLISLAGEHRQKSAEYLERLLGEGDAVLL